MANCAARSPSWMALTVAGAVVTPPFQATADRPVVAADGVDQLVSQLLQAIQGGMVTTASELAAGSREMYQGMAIPTSRASIVSHLHAVRPFLLLRCGGR